MENVSMSVSNIAGNKMRTFLTTLGIIIGVGAIIALMTVVQGATDTMNAQFDAMGLGTLRISVTGTDIKRGLTDANLEQLLACDHVAGISPSLNCHRDSQARGCLVGPGSWSAATTMSISGITPICSPAGGPTTPWM